MLFRSMAAIKRGERGQAREILNRILVHIYHVARDRMDLLKSFTMELVVMMTRAAVEAGAEPSSLLGLNYSSLTALSGIDDEEKLSAWLTEMLERLMDGIRDNCRFPNMVLLSKALTYMSENFHRELGRTEVARHAGLSPGHLSFLLKERTGRSFTDILIQQRINHARELLAHTEKSVVQIAIECGFCDQSHFSRSFSRHVGETPRGFRKKNSAPAT